MFNINCKIKNTEIKLRSLDLNLTTIIYDQFIDCNQSRSLDKSLELDSISKFDFEFWVEYPTIPGCLLQTPNCCKSINSSILMSTKNCVSYPINLLWWGNNIDRNSRMELVSKLTFHHFQALSLLLLHCIEA